MGIFAKCYPGVYSEREKPLVESCFAANRALAERGPIDVQKLIVGELEGTIRCSRPKERFIKRLAERYTPLREFRRDWGAIPLMWSQLGQMAGWCFCFRMEMRIQTK